MLRRLQASIVLSVWAVALSAAAQEPAAKPKPDEKPAGEASTSAPADATKPGEDATKPATEPAAAPATEPAPEASSAAVSTDASVEAAASAPAPSTEANPPTKPAGFNVFVSGYFRAPISISFSPRPGPENLNGPDQLQVSYGPNRIIDSNYYSFAYTRIQEQDWAEVFIHAKKKHVEAVVGWMGYWYQSASFRNPDASWVPGMAYLTLDTDFKAGKITPNIAATVGAWWPKFGQFQKYDTYMLGQFRQIGEQLKLTVPFTPDLSVELVQGFGTARDGKFIYQPETIPPIYGAKVGLDLLVYENVSVNYKKILNVGLHHNHEWTRDPNLYLQASPDKNFAKVANAHVTTIGGEVGVTLPRAGSLWVSPSLISVKNGWALGSNGGTEVLHSLSGGGLASNYLAWTNSPSDSTGSGSLFNVGLLYENTLSNILGKERGSTPDAKLNLFGMMVNSSLDLPAGSKITQDQIKQFKYGADLTVYPLSWLGVMARWDQVNYDLDNPGYVFSSITGRLSFSSHFLSSESIYLQYSRYQYGDHMVLAGKWPWGTPLIAGSDILQGGPYNGWKPDMDVLKIQAEVSF